MGIGDSQVELSVVVPFLNESASLEELAGEIKEACEGLGRTFEIIFVDDGSRDGSFEIVRRLAEADGRVRGVRFRRNEGKSAALGEGFARARGEVIITMDADLQDDPSEIPRLLAKLDEGYGLVSGWKKKRRDPITRRIPSRIFNLVTRLMARISIHDFNCGFKAYRAEAAHAITLYGELHRYIPVLVHWEGFRVGEVPVRHRRRPYGKSKYGLSRYVKGFLDFITVSFLGKYTTRPLHFFGIFGGVLLIAGFATNAYLTVQWFGGRWIGNRPLLFLGILLMIVGVQFISLGLLGEMVTSAVGERTHGVAEVVGDGEQPGE